MNSNFKLSGIQTVLFLSDFRLTDKPSFTKELLDLTKDIFNDEPLILPIPDDAPKDIPRIILKSTNSSYYVNVSLDRLDFNFRVIDEGEDLKFEEIIDGHLNNIEKIYNFLLNYEHTRISRIGFIARFFIKLEGGSPTFIKNKFLKEGLFPNARSIDILENEKISLDSYQLNKLINIKSLRKKEEEEFKGLLTEIDINTIKERDYDFKIEPLKKLLIEIKKYIIKNDLPQSIFSG